MLAGRAAFDGEDVADTLGAVLKSEPDWTALPARIPARLHELVNQCLVKEPHSRLQAIGDARIEIEKALNRRETDGRVLQSAHRAQRRLAWTVNVFLAACVILLAFLHFSAPPIETAAAEFAVAPPAGTVFIPLGAPAASFTVASPDGRHIAFLAARLGERGRIWVRSIDSSEARVLAGTDGAVNPFWSPDSRSIGFFTPPGRLNKIDFSGGPVQVLWNEGGVLPEGGTWNPRGIILFAPNAGLGGLYRIPDSGGSATPVTVPDAASRETSHRLPYFLPDGRHFLYLSQPNTINVGSLDSKETKRLLNADSRAIYAPPGFLVFVRQGTLIGQSFDVKSLRLTGEPFRIAENIAYDPSTGRAPFSVSDSGLLTYRLGQQAGLRLAWFDRNGRQEVETINQTGDSRGPRLSPDGTRIAIERQENGQSDIWVIDLARGTNTRLTFSPGNETTHIWSPDGSRVLYAHSALDSNGKRELYQKLANGSGNEELVLKSDFDIVPTDWSKDGRFILYTRTPTSGDVWILPMMGDRKPMPFLQTPFSENAAQFSPDGKWVAYWSNESGIQQIYVQPFPQASDKVQISVDGGSLPRWSDNGKELFFASSDGTLMVVDVQLGSQFRAGVPKALFRIPRYGGAQTGGIGRYSVSPDGERFLFPVNNIPEDSPLTVTLNWTTKLKR
jgi:Tol biopolymer transport system component